MSNDSEIGLNYAAAQLAKALETAEAHPEGATRNRASKKGESWIQVLTGMVSGILDIGSRRPSKLPIWATLEVLRGGFSTGKPLAGGPLAPHELELATQRNLVCERSQLNRYFVSPTGLAELQALLASSHYRVELPEESALLTVAWLAQHGHTQQACDLVQEIAPHFEELRFYPIFSPNPQSLETVQLRSVEEVSQSLSDLKNRPQFTQMKEIIFGWLPLKDRLINLLLETLDGELPQIFGGQLQGGWPLQHYPDGWKQRAAEAVTGFHAFAKDHTGWSPNRDLPHLVEVLHVASVNSAQLTGRQIGKARRILADYTGKRGLPGSPRHAEIRKEQQRVAGLPGRADLVPLLQERLGILHTLEAKGSEAVREFLLAPDPNNRPIPRSLAVKALRCWKTSPESLVEWGVVRSGETLATLLPKLSSQVPGSQFSNGSARLLFEATYVAFRKRRSLLLVRLQSQVKLEELPWVKALLRHADQSSKEYARATLTRFLSLYFKRWPQAMLPNKLVTELKTLCLAAQLDLPLLEQVAADIFMGTFSEKFLRAAKLSAPVLGNTIYQSYYGLDYDKVLKLNDLEKVYGNLASPGFAALCENLAGVKSGGSVVANGKVIEQCQILTSHNLALLWHEFELQKQLSAKTLAQDCFSRIVRAQTLSYSDWRSNLKARSRCAYAWRQMVFFLSTLSEPEVQDFFVWAKTRLRNPKLDSSVGVWLEDLHRSFNGEARISRPLLGWVTKADLNKN